VIRQLLAAVAEVSVNGEGKLTLLLRADKVIE
jgi:hypothetical protein